MRITPEAAYACKFYEYVKDCFIAYDLYSRPIYSKNIARFLLIGIPVKYG